MSRGTSKVGPSAERFHKLAHVSERIDRSVSATSTGTSRPAS